MNLNSIRFNIGFFFSNKKEKKKKKIVHGVLCIYIRQNFLVNQLELFDFISKF